MSGQAIFESPVVPSDFGRETPGLRQHEQPRLGEALSKLLTRDEVEELVRRAVGPGAQLANYQLSPYSHEKIGYLGAHLRLGVRLAGASEPRSFFLKTLPYDVPSQAAYIEEKGCFRKEADFFGRLVPLMHQRYRAEPWMPTCLLAKQNLLVFEDLKLRGFANRPRLFDEATMMAGAACLARFHAASLLAEEQLAGKTLLDVFPELLEESEFKRTGRSYEWYRTAMKLAVQLAQSMGLDGSAIDSASEVVFEMTKPSTTKRNVVSHGDLWSSNLMFDGSDRCLLVDFQLVRYAPLGHDVMQLLYLTGSRQLRRRHERQVLRHYHDSLERALAASGYGAAVPDFDQLLRTAEEQRLAAVVTAVIFFPTVLMDGRTAATIMDDPDTYEAYYFRDRLPFVRDIMARDKQYEQRIKEAVAELVEMSLVAESLPRPT